ncbi:hypothetical protein PIB30_102555, partial [Stylosanthes scabra]|nr:hypothetical protein [Stylosanthes scabra]
RAICAKVWQEEAIGKYGEGERKKHGRYSDPISKEENTRSCVNGVSKARARRCNQREGGKG